MVRSGPNMTTGSGRPLEHGLLGRAARRRERVRLLQRAGPGARVSRLSGRSADALVRRSPRISRQTIQAATTSQQQPRRPARATQLTCAGPARLRGPGCAHAGPARARSRTGRAPRRTRPSGSSTNTPSAPANPSGQQRVHVDAVRRRRPPAPPRPRRSAMLARSRGGRAVARGVGRSNAPRGLRVGRGVPGAGQRGEACRRRGPRAPCRAGAPGPVRARSAAQHRHAPGPSARRSCRAAARRPAVGRPGRRAARRRARQLPQRGFQARRSRLVADDLRRRQAEPRRSPRASPSASASPNGLLGRTAADAGSCCRPAPPRTGSAPAGPA